MWELQVEAASSPHWSPFAGFQARASSPSAQNFLYIPQQLKGLLSPTGRTNDKGNCVSPCRPVQRAWKEKLLSPGGRFARAAAITDVVTQPHSAGAVWCLSSQVCGRVLITRTVHTLIHTHKTQQTAAQPRRAVSHVPQLQGASGRRLTNQLLQEPSLYYSSFHVEPHRCQVTLFFPGPTAHSCEEHWAASEKDLFPRNLSCLFLPPLFPFSPVIAIIRD